MTSNALVGNAADHPRNHRLLRVGAQWRLLPAFDITPLAEFRKVLSMATGADASSAVSVARLVASCGRFELCVRGCRRRSCWS